MLPHDWTTADSSAIEAYRYLPELGILQIAFVKGRQVYDYPCTEQMYRRFRSAPSMGRFVTEVLRPYAASRNAVPRGYPRPW